MQSVNFNQKGLSARRGAALCVWRELLVRLARPVRRRQLEQRHQCGPVVLQCEQHLVELEHQHFRAST
nr:MAG TPA: hypothetical protein [Caudoviricetes sp.]